LNGMFESASFRFELITKLRLWNTDFLNKMSHLDSKKNVIALRLFPMNSFGKKIVSDFLSLSFSSVRPRSLIHHMISFLNAHFCTNRLFWGTRLFCWGDVLIAKWGCFQVELNSSTDPNKSKTMIIPFCNQQEFESSPVEKDKWPAVSCCVWV
jgi:hypothetical protein